MKEKYNIEKISLVREETNFERIKINSSLIAADYCRKFFFEDLTIYESFFLILLNNSAETIGYAKISQGGIAGTVVDPRLVAKYAVESLCSAVILCHNHPSGVLVPSGADKAITKKIENGLALFDIKVFDHIILTEKSYLSFADEGLI